MRIRLRSGKPILIAALLVALAALLSACNLSDMIDTTARLCGPSEYAVTTFEDKNDEQCTEDDCSLREAVITANLCPGEKTILLDSGTYDLTIAGRDEDSAATGDLDITDDLVIRGSRSTIDGADVARIFHVIGEDTNVQLGGIIVQGGGVPEGDIGSDGSAILNGGSLQITNAIFRANTSTLSAVLLNEGVLQMRDTQLLANEADSILINLGVAQLFDVEARDNVSQEVLRSHPSPGTDDRMHLEGVIVAGNQGTAVMNAVDEGVGELTVVESTIHNNSGDGILNQGIADVRRSTLSENACSGFDNQVVGDLSPQANLVNTTISGQRMLRTGEFRRWGTCRAVEPGLDASGGEVTMNHVTVYGNVGEGMVISRDASATIMNSIVAKNGFGNCLLLGSVNNEGGNVYGSGDLAFGTDEMDCEVSEDDLQVDASELGVGELSDNGGPTQTHELQEGSPAVDFALSEACLETDQRGVARPVGGGCDSGAYESSFAVTASEPTATPTEAAPMQVNFNADVYTIERGQCTTLRWRVSGASSISLLGQEVEATGADEVCPSETTGYTLFAESDADEASEYLEIAVTEPTDDSLSKGCFVNGVCTVPCPGDPVQYGGVCYE